MTTHAEIPTLRLPRGGRFIALCSGEQFALPEAVGAAPRHCASCLL
ncbi:MAG: hypothetical protein ACREXU_12795 [Gammaproteobacteria bacterium]